MDLCQIMMVQTATRRLAKLKRPDLIITDENHHCLAPIVSTDLPLF